MDCYCLNHWFNIFLWVFAILGIGSVIEKTIEEFDHH